MKQNNTKPDTIHRSINEEAQKKRRKDAIQSAITSSLLMLGSGSLLLFLRSHYEVQGIGRALLLIFALLDLGMILPVWILLKKRLQEIEGGEEDAAAQY